MKTSAVRPYLVPAETAVDVDTWTDSAGAPLPETVDYWDSATDLQLSRVARVDTDRIRRECQLDGNASFAVVVTWYSSSTRLNGGPAPVELGQRTGRLEVSLDLNIPGAEVGGTVRLRTRLVLRHPGTRTGPLSPVATGSVLWSDEQVFDVEGSAGQFPIAVVDFASTEYPVGAAWVLSWGEGRLHEPVLGDFRLLLNAQHPTVMSVVGTGAGDPRTATVRSVLRYEVLRAIVCVALADEEFCRQPDQYDEGTVGDLAEDLVRLVFHDMDVTVLGRWLRDAPEKIDAALQAYTGLLT